MSGKNHKNGNKGGSVVTADLSSVFAEVKTRIEQADEAALANAIATVSDLFFDFTNLFGGDNATLLVETEVAHAMRQEGYRLKGLAATYDSSARKAEEELVEVQKRLKELGEITNEYYNEARKAVMYTISPNGRAWGSILEMTKGHQISKQVEENIHLLAMRSAERLHPGEFTEQAFKVKEEKELLDTIQKDSALADEYGKAGEEQFENARQSLELLGFDLGKEVKEAK